MYDHFAGYSRLGFGFVPRTDASMLLACTTIAADAIAPQAFRIVENFQARVANRWI